MCSHGIFFKSDNKTSVISNKIIFLTKMGKLQVSKEIYLVCWEKQVAFLHTCNYVAHRHDLSCMDVQRDEMAYKIVHNNMILYTYQRSNCLLSKDTCTWSDAIMIEVRKSVSIHSNYFEIFNHMQEVMIAVQPIFVLSANNFM